MDDCSDILVGEAVMVTGSVGVTVLVGGNAVNSKLLLGGMMCQEGNTLGLGTPPLAMLRCLVGI